MSQLNNAKALAYRKTRNIGIILVIVQLTILTFALNRSLVADTFHATIDVLGIGGYAYLLGGKWIDEHTFQHKKRRWLIFGVWSLAIGGLFVAGESAWQLMYEEIGTPPPSTPILVAAILGAVGNWRMHHILHSVEDHMHDALHKNNIDHVFWDMFLSLAVFVSYMTVALFHTVAFDHYIAILVGAFILPYLARKRWREEARSHSH